MGESKSYLVIVSVRDSTGAISYHRERIVAQSPAQAAKIAKSRHGGVISTRVVGER